ncbi:MAG: DUF5004 domain-containing protein [Pedobacter sp.]|nr:MAG: DUF5004 domain-containing protein [Pedobacter sp.]
MKRIWQTAMSLITVALLVTGCQPDAFKDAGAPRDVKSSIIGTWKLTKATQVDEESARKGFPYRELDITTIYPYTDFVLKLDAGEPGNFTTTPGASPRIIRFATGTWTLNDPEFPSALLLKNGTTTDTATLGGYPVGAATTLKIKLRKKEAATGKLLISYTYEFAKQ